MADSGDRGKGMKKRTDRKVFGRKNDGRSDDRRPRRDDRRFNNKDPKPHGDRDHGDRKFSKRDGNKDFGDRKFQKRDGDRRFSKSDDKRSGDRPRRDRDSGRDDKKYVRHDRRSDRKDPKPRDFKHRDGDRSDRDGKKFDRFPKKEHRDRSERQLDRPRKNDYHTDRDRRPSRETIPKTTAPKERPRLIISSDPQRLLFKGVDLQAEGDNRSALIMFVHGSVLMSKGCENNAVRLIKGLTPEDRDTLVESVKSDCSEDALIEIDYILRLADDDHEFSTLKEAFGDGKPQAVYRMICLGELDPEDPVIDVFSQNMDDPRVTEGLRLLSRKHDSSRARKGLQDIEDRKKRRLGIHDTFNQAMSGNGKALRELEKMSSEFPEAQFFCGYVKAREDGNGIQWLKDNYDQYKDIMIQEEFGLRIGDDPFGMFLRAKKIQSKKEDWIPSMIKAAKNGSEEAMKELVPLMKRTDIKRAVADIHLRNGDLPALIDDYVNGLDDIVYLDRYCENDPFRIADLGKDIGEIDPERGIDWLRAHAFTLQCREMLVTLSKDERYRSRKMIYALHDVGKNIEAADLYFDMEGNPDLPATKWLKKVCRDEEAKEHVRKHYESVDDLATFDSIFEDDGYKPRPKRGRRSR